MLLYDNIDGGFPGRRYGSLRSVWFPSGIFRPMDGTACLSRRHGSTISLRQSPSVAADDFPAQGLLLEEDLKRTH
jgi:hypothetical protein